MCEENESMLLKHNARMQLIYIIFIIFCGVLLLGTFFVLRKNSGLKDEFSMPKKIHETRSEQSQNASKDDSQETSGQKFEHMNLLNNNPLRSISPKVTKKNSDSLS